MHRIFFHIGPVEIAAYGVMVALGMLAAVWVAVTRAKKLGEQPSVILDLTLWVVISGIFGARFVFVFLEGWREVLSKPFIETLKYFILIRQGGLSFLGAFLFAAPTGIIYLKVKKLNVWNYADICAPSIPLGIAFARIGCFLNGCCFGKPAPHDSMCSVEFPAGSLPYGHYHEVIPIYPTQLISSLNTLIIFVILSLLFRKRRFEGQIFWMLVVLYSITRFIIDFLRGDSGESFFGGLLFGVLTLAQIICLIGLIAGILMLMQLRKKTGRSNNLPV